MFGYIYITTNIVNKKQYIGRKKSSTFLGNEYLGSGKHLGNAVAKYGSENFSVELLEECDSEEELYSREEFWISHFDAMNSDKFYNHSPGGKHDGFLCGEENISCHLSVESKRRLIEALRSKRDSDETRRKKSIALLGRKKSAETRARMSIAQSGERSSHYGKKASTETRQKLSLVRSGKGNPIYHKVCINNGYSNKYVNNSDVNEFVASGWVIGTINVPPPTRGKWFINNGIISTTCSPDDFPKYEILGFVRGRLKNKNKKSSTTIESQSANKSEI